MQIRLAHISEAETIYAILLSVREEIGLEQRFERPEYRDWTRGECEKQLFWVAVRDNDIVGTILLKPNNISYLAVKREHWGSGIGPCLVQVAKSRYAELHAETKPDNERMIALLRREGFERYVAGDPPRRFIAFRWSQSR